MDRSNPILDDSDEEKILEDQLRSTLRQDLARALHIKRPLLTHLNADTTWLLSIPIPEQARPATNKKRKRDNASGVAGLRDRGSTSGTAHPAAQSKQFFHILIDPWLRGSQSDVAQFFSQQWHAHESAVQTISEVEEAIRDMEDLASHDGASPPADLSSATKPSSQVAIDAVVVSHEFTDHMHKETLLEVPVSVPVFASYKAASIIKSWRHFDIVVTLPTNLTGQNRDWRTTSVAPLPPWLGISRLGQDKVDLLYYHSAVMIAFSSTSSGGDGGVDRGYDDESLGGEDEEADTEAEAEAEAEAVIYTPHGITTEDLKPVAQSSPPIRTLALLHGLHDVRIGAPQLNLGAHNGLKVQRLTRAKYWVGTHDEVKRGGGIVSWFLRRRVYTVREAIEKARKEEEEKEKEKKKSFGDVDADADVDMDVEDEERGDDSSGLGDVRFVDLGNGESLLLE